MSLGCQWPVRSMLSPRIASKSQGVYRRGWPVTAAAAQETRAGAQRLPSRVCRDSLIFRLVVARERDTTAREDRPIVIAYLPIEIRRRDAEHPIRHTNLPWQDDGDEAPEQAREWPTPRQNDVRICRYDDQIAVPGSALIDEGRD